VKVTGPLDRGYFRSLYFSDPDGQILEIATAGPGYAIDEPADALGRQLLVPPTERLPEGRDQDAIAATTHPEPVPEVTPEMRLRGIHHISAITDDLAAAGDFYEQALGLKLVKKTYNQDDATTKHYFWAAYDDGVVHPHSAMTLFGWEGSDRTARPGTGQTHHVAFRARNAEEQLAWREHLLGLGLNVSPVMDRSYFESIYFRAPDGLLCEIATDGPGFAIDESEETLGEGLMLPAWLEPRRGDIERSLVALP
jgi:glyoxalase family protein